MSKKRYLSVPCVFFLHSFLVFACIFILICIGYLFQDQVGFFGLIFLGGIGFVLTFLPFGRWFDKVQKRGLSKKRERALGMASSAGLVVGLLLNVFYTLPPVTAHYLPPWKALIRIF